MKGYGLMIIVGIVALPLAYLTSSGGETSRNRKPKQQPTDVFVAAPISDNSGKPATETGRPKSRLVARMLKLLDDAGIEGSDEERKALRESLLQADEELHRSSGENARRKILEANNPRPRPIIGRRRGGSSVNPKIVSPPSITPKIEAGEESAPPAVEIKPIPAKEPTPAKDLPPAEPTPAKSADPTGEPTPAKPVE